MHKESISINSVEIKKAMLSKEDLCSDKGSYKYYIEYISDAGMMPLDILLPKMNAYTKYHSNSTYMK